MNDDELESIEKLHLSSDQGITTPGPLNGVISGTTTNIGGFTTSPYTGSAGQILTDSSSGIGWSTMAGGNSTEMDLDMADFIELVQTSDLRGELLLAFGKMIIDKLQSMPNNGGLELKHGCIGSGYSQWIGNAFACALANAWGYPIASVIQTRVFKNGDFKFKVSV